MKRILLIIMPLLAFYSCNTNNSQTEVFINIKGAAGKKITLYREPFVDEMPEKLDSAVVIDLNHPVIFTIRNNEQRLYSLRVENSNKTYHFINDVPEIKIQANNINGKYDIAGSPASVSLKQFNDDQGKISLLLHSYINDLKQINKEGKNELGVAIKKYDSLHLIFTGNYNNYADTVKNPAAFMAVYLNINFDNDYNRLKKFTDKASLRFPDYKPVTTLKKASYEMIDIFEKEFNIGDILPEITLPDSGGKNFSTSLLKGKYYFIDFWASWCSKCDKYTFYKKQLWSSFGGKNFQIVSVALDDKQTWENKIKLENFQWPQLIDEKLWRGVAANTLKFDSIPFNFFVNPKGVILAKAIRPDSLEVIVSQYIR